MNAIADLGIIIAAGGTSRRYGHKNKLFELIDGIPVFIFSIADFACLCPPECMVLVVPEKDMNEFKSLLAKFLPHITVNVVAGGDNRCKSVCNGLEHLPPNVEYVAVHDAARPLASAEVLKECLKQARKYDGAIAGRPITDTIKKSGADSMIVDTVDRSELWTVETPQVFKLDKLKQAYEKALASGNEFTDDAGVMEYNGCKVKLVHYKVSNFKITWPGDTIIAEAVIKSHRC